MKRFIVAAVAAACLAATIGWLLSREEESTSGPVAPASTPATETSRATDDDAADRTARKKGGVEGASAPAAPSPERARPEPVERAAVSPDHFDVRALEEAGYRPHEIEAIRTRWQEAAARVRAAREEMPPAAPVSPQREALDFDAAMRELLRDDDYDAGRYATGRDNRVEIRWLANDEVSAATGLQPGDRIVAYDGTPVYTSAEYLEHRRLDRAAGVNDYDLTVERDGNTRLVPVRDGEVWMRFKDVRVPPQ